MDWFFDMIDLGENLRRGLAAVRNLSGIPAIITGGVLALISFLFLNLAWHFDLHPTYVWTQIAIDKLTPTFGPTMTAYIPVLVFTLTMLPTLIELFTTRFARYDILLAQWMVYFFVVFDWLTDWPAASDFVDAYATSGVFEQAGIMYWPTLYFCKIAWLLLASFGFEMLGIVFAICALACTLNVTRNVTSATTAR